MNYWSRDYVAAVANFHLALDKLKQRGVEFSHQRLMIDQCGPQDEQLAIDVVLIGSTEASNCLMLSSGVHGVEGFAGSAIQIAILER